MVDIILTIWSKARLVSSRLRFAEDLKIAAIQFHAAEMALAGVVCISGYIQCAGVLINSVDIKDFKVSLCNLVLQLSFIRKGVALVKRVEVQVSVSVAPA
jgi:hypothetical protein